MYSRVSPFVRRYSTTNGPFFSMLNDPFFSNFFDPSPYYSNRNRNSKGRNRSNWQNDFMEDDSPTLSSNSPHWTSLMRGIGFPNNERLDHAMEEFDNMAQQFWEREQQKYRQRSPRAQAQPQPQTQPQLKDGKDNKETQAQAANGDQDVERKYDEPQQAQTQSQSDPKSNTGMVESSGKSSSESRVGRRRSFGNFLNPFSLATGAFSLKDNGDHYEISADTTGFSKDHLDLQIRDGYLVMTGRVEEEVQKEHSYSKSTRMVNKSIFLPKDADTETIKAKFVEDNKISVTLTKKKGAEKEKDNKIQIE